MAMQFTKDHSEQPRGWKHTIYDYMTDHDIKHTAATPLQGGHSAYIWRIDGYEDPISGAINGPCVLKYAEETAKGSPSIIADALRMQFEARALISRPVANACLSEPSVQVPKVLRTTDRALLMTWGGEIDLRSAYVQGSSFDAGDIGARLGRWLACLHLAGFEDEQVRAYESEMIEPVVAGEHENLRKTMIARGMGESAAHEAMVQLRKDAGPRTMTVWDFRPMNTLLRFSNATGSEPGLTVIDWECSRYGCPVDDLSHWVAEALVLEAKHGNGPNMLPRFLAAYVLQASERIVTADFVCKLAISVASTLLSLAPSGLWDTDKAEAEFWVARGLQFVHAAVMKDMAWFSSSEFSPLCHNPTYGRL